MVRCEHYALRLAGCRTTARDRPYYMHGFASPTVSCNQWFSSTNGGWLQDDRKGSSLLYAPSLPRFVVEGFSFYNLVRIVYNGDEKHSI